MYIKNRILSNIVQIISLLLMVLFIHLVISPSLEKLKSEIESGRDDIVSELSDFTGLDISYGSISPLIVDSIIVRDISATTDTGNHFLEISKIEIQFSIINIILSQWKKVDPPDMISNIFLYSSNVGLDLTDLDFFDNLSSISAPSRSFFKGKLYFNDLNVDLHLNELDIDVNNAKGSLTGRYARYETILNASTTLDFHIDTPFSYIKTDVGFKGNFSKNFLEIDSLVDLSNIESDIGDLRDLNVNFYMLNEEIIVKNRDKNSDLDLTFKCRIPNLDLFFKVVPDNLIVKDLFQPAEDFTLVDNFINSTITGNYSAGFNVIYNTLNYSGEGNIKHYQHPLSINSGFNFTGDLEDITFDYLNLWTNYGYLGFNGRVDLKTLFPKGYFYVRDAKVGEKISIDSNFYIAAIDQNFINLDFEYIEGAGLRVNDIASIVYIDEEDVSFQGLKKDENGKISLSGNYNLDSGEIDSYLQVDQFHLDFIDGIINSEYLNNIVEQAKLSFTAEFNFIDGMASYGINDLILTDDEKPFFETEGTGTNRSFVLDYLTINKDDLQFHSRVEGTINEDVINLNFDSLINDNKYKIDINIDDNTIIGSGSYGLDFSVVTGDNLFIDIYTENLPMQFRDYKLVTSIDFKGVLFNDGDFQVSIPSLSASVESSSFKFTPEVSFSLDGSQDQILISEIKYNDGVEELSGNVILKSEQSGIYSLMAGFSSLENEEISLNSLFDSNNNFINLDLDFKDFLMDRIYFDELKGHSSGEISLKGTMDEFELLGHLESDNLLLSDNNMNISLDLSLTDELLTLTGVEGIINGNVIKVPVVSYNYNKGKLNAVSTADFTLGNYKGDTGLSIDLTLNPLDSIFNITQNNFEYINGNISLLDMTLDDEKIFSNKVFRIFNNSSAIQIYSEDRNFKLVYSYATGLLKAIIEKPYFAAMNLKGTIKDGVINLDANDIDIDLSIADKFLDVGTLDLLELHGALSFTGETGNPDINGLLYSDVNLSLDNVPEEIKPVRINILAEDSKFTILDSKIEIGEESLINIEGEIILDSWNYESILIKADIPYEKLVNIRYNYGVIVIETGLYSDGFIFYMDNAGARINGEVVIENGDYYMEVTSFNDIEVTVDTISDVENSEGGLNLEVDLNVIIGSGNRLLWPNRTVPILSATLKSGDGLEILYKSVTGEYQVNGEISIIDGEVDYSGDPFTLQEGYIKLDLTNDHVDPYINIVASKTVLDDEDKQVEVYLSFEGGFFSTFTPNFYSNDASKTQEEIDDLVSSAFTDNLAAGLIDEVAFSLITTPFEQSLEDIFNVDQVKIESGFLSSLFSNITNYSFDSTDDTSYTVAEMFNGTSMEFGNFITEDFFGKVSIGSVYEDETLQPELNLGLTLYSPHFQLGLNMEPQLSDDYIFEPELELSLEWVYNPEKGK